MTKNVKNRPRRPRQGIGRQNVAKFIATQFDEKMTKKSSKMDPQNRC
jgi:hypothetical protein